MTGNRRPSGSRGRTAQSRKIISRPGAVPQWAYVALIAGPAVGIIVLLLATALKGHKVKEAPPPDPNRELKVLEAQVPELEKALHEVVKLQRAEDPLAERKFEEVRDRFDAWCVRWDQLVESHRDADGNLPPELQYLTGIRRQVNVLLSDLIKSSGF